MDKIVNQLATTPPQGEDTVLPLLQLMMNICMQELTRQVSVHCLERGHLLKRVFQAYIRLIDLLSLDHAAKRKAVKHDYALKLDRYVTILEQQALGHQSQIEGLEQQSRLQRAEIEEMQAQLRRQSLTLQKYKKKVFKQQRDQEANEVRLRFSEKESAKLRQRLGELREEYRVETGEMDETDRQRLMLEVEREIQEADRVREVQMMQTLYAASARKFSAIESTSEEGIQ